MQLRWRHFLHKDKREADGVDGMDIMGQVGSMIGSRTALSSRSIK
jgi:hypothetical protein